MKPLLTPTAAEVVRCVRDTLETLITPALKGRSEFSYATTANHLLTLVERRLESEGQTLLDEIRKLHGIFPDALAWLATQPGNDALSTAISASLRRERDPNVYPSLRLMAEEVAALRQHVCDLLLLLQKSENGAGSQLHAALRSYIAWQLEQEGSIVEPSFVGRGPRR
jgi:hypothetical protein